MFPTSSGYPQSVLINCSKRVPSTAGLTSITDIEDV